MKFDAPEVRVSVALDGAVEVAPRPFELGGMAGTRVVLARGWAVGSAETTLVCVSAPTQFWVPGLEATLLDAASAKVRAGAHLSTLEVDPIERGLPYTQHFSGFGDTVVATGRHVLGFLGARDEVLVCSTVCTAPRVDAASVATCELALRRYDVEAAFTLAPPPGPILRLATTAAERPREALVVFASVAALAVALLLRWRPRPGRAR